MSISRKFQRSKSKYTLSQKIISAVTAAGFIMQPIVGFAGQIIKQNDLNNNLIKNGVADIWADKVVDKTAINVFNKFNLSANEIANMYFGLKGTEHNSANLVNFVNDRIDINGTVNAIQNSQIGGNLFFLSKDGMAVGKSGVINTGSLYVMTPATGMPDVTGTVEDYNATYEGLKGIFNSGQDANNANEALVRMQTLNIPLNADGTITVLGTINAVGDVKMAAPKIAVGKNNTDDIIYGVAAGEILDNTVNKAYIKTGVTDFAAFVKLTPEQQKEVGLTTLKATTDGSGDIVLAAKAEYGNSFDQNFSNIGTLVGVPAPTTDNKIEAIVENYGVIDASGDAVLTAEVTNGNKDWAEEILDQNTPNGVNNPDYVPVPAANANNNIQTVATVNVQGDVIAKGDIELSASADNTYVDNGTGMINSFENILGLATPMGANVMILSNKAEITVGKDVKIEAGGTIDVNANAVLDGTAGKAVNGRKLIKFVPDAIPSASVVYSHTENDAVVNIEGNLTANGQNKTGDNGEVIPAVNVSAYAEENMSSNAALNLKSGTLGAGSPALAAAVNISESENNANVTIRGNITADNGDAVVKADTFNLITANASTNAPDDSVGATAVNVVTHSSNAGITIDGDIKAQNVTVDATNYTDENTITANNALGMGKLQAQLMNAVNVHGLVEALKNNPLVNKGDDGSTDGIFKQLSEKLAVGAAVVVADEENTAKVTFGKTADVTATKGSIEADADVNIYDSHIYASGTANSYKNNDGSGTTDTVTVGAGVVYSGMDNNASVVFADGDGASGDESHATLTAAKDINITSGTTIEYHRPERIKREIDRSIENLKYAIAAIKNLDEYEQEKFTELVEGLNGLVKNLEGYAGNYTNEFIDAVSNPDAITAEGTMNDIFDAAAGAIAIYNNVLELQQNFNDMLDVTSPFGAVVTNALGVVTNAVAFADPNNYANVAASASAKGGSDGTKFAASGAVTVTDYNNTSKVDVGRFTALNAGNKLDLTSSNKVEDVNITGKTKFWKNSADAKGGLGIGASVNYQNFDTDSSVVVDKGAELEAGDISIGSDSDIFHVGAMLSAGKSDGSALSGMVTITDSDSYNNVIVDADAVLTAEKDTENGGTIDIWANNNTSVNNAILSVSASGDNVGAGIGVAINNIDVQNTAQIKDNDGTEGEKDEVEGEISASKLSVNAETTGLINTISIAGGMTSSGESEEDGFFDKIKAPFDKINATKDNAIKGIENISNKLQNVLSTMEYNKGAGNGDTTADAAAGVPSFTLAGAGSVSLNLVGDTTKAIIDGANINLNDGILQVGARDSAFTGAWSGAAALSFREAGSSGTSVAIMGAVGVNDIDNEITALVNNSTVTGAKDVDVAAVSGGTTVAAGIGATFTSDEEQKGSNYSGGASVSVNLIDKNVNANMNGVTLVGAEDKKANIAEDKKANIDVAAYESDVQVTGGVNANIATGGGSLVGGGVTVADIKNNINAGIIGGEYTNVNNVNVKALLAVTQVTAALSAGIAAGGSGTNNAFGGAVVYNGLSNDITAGIDGATITAGGNVAVTAKDTESGSKEAEPYQGLLGDYNKHNEFAKERGIDTNGSSYYATSEENALDTAGESINYDASKGSTIVGAAAVVTAGSNSNAGGAAVNIADIDNDFTAKINNATITAKSVHAEADADTLIVNASGGVAAGTKSFGGMGSVTWQDIDNDLTAEFNNSKITTNTATAKAINNTQAVNVAGSVAFGKSAGIGATLAYNALDNTTGAYMKGNTISSFDNSNVNVIVDADNTGKVYGIGAGVAASTKVAINGSVAVNRGGSNTEAVIDNAVIDNSEEKKSVIENAGNVDVTAADDTYRIAVVGQASVSGKAAIGGGVAYNDVGGSSTDTENSSQSTLAAIKDTTITMAENAENTVNVSAKDKSALKSIAVGVAAAANAGVQGSAATSLINKNTSAVIENSDIDKVGGSTANVIVDADNLSSITSSADTASVAAQGAGVGAGIAVNRIIQQTNATVNGGTMNVNNLTVKANGTPRIENIGVGIAVAGQGAGVTGSVSVNMIDNDVTAHIGSGANITADGSVGVVATSDEQIANYAGQAAVAGQGAGVGVSVAVNQIAGTTSATVGGKDEAKTSVTAKGKSSLNTNTFIRGYEYGYENKDETKNSQINNALISQDTVSMNTTINRESENRSGLVVDASSTRDMKSFLLTVGVGGMGAGVTGTVNVNMIKGATNAGVANTIVDGTVGGANAPDKVGVFVNAGDYTNMSGFVGSGGVGGIGAGVGLGSDTNTFSRNVEAVVENSDIKANTFEVDADSQQGISSFAVGAGIAGVGGGVAGIVTVTELENATKAALLNSNVNANTVNINANHTGVVNAGNVSAGVGGVGAGVGLSVGVLKDNSSTEVTVGDDEEAKTQGRTNITAANDVNIAAENTAVVKPMISATGGAGVGAAVAGATSVNNLNSVVKTNINNAYITSNNGNISGTANNTFNVEAYSGGNAVGGAGIGVGANVTVNTIDSTVQTNVSDSTLNAKVGNVILTADEDRNIEQLATNIAAGGIAAGANIAITSVGEAIGNEDSEKISNKSDNYKEANDAAADKIKEANNAYGANDTKTLLGDSAGALGTADIDDIKLSVDAGYGGLEDENGNKISQITVNITNSNIDAGNNVTAKATESDNISMTLGSGVAGAAAVNAGVGILNVHRNVGVNINGGQIDAKTVDIDTDITGKANLNVYQGSAGVVGANAAVGQVNTTGSSSITVNDVDFTADEIDILAADHGISKVNTLGITVGAVSVGAIVAMAENTGNTSVAITNSSATAKDDADESSITISTEKANTVDAHATGGTGGVLSGSGVVATASDSGTSSITVGAADGGKNTFKLNNINIAASAKPFVKAVADSVSVGFLGTAGASVATATATGGASVNVHDGNEFIADTVNIDAKIATQDGKNTVEALVEGNSGGGYASVNANAATATADMDVRIDVGDVDYKTETTNVTTGYEYDEAGNKTPIVEDVTNGATALNITASNTAKNFADARGVTIGGLFSSGNNVAKTENLSTTTVNFSGSEDENATLLDSLNIAATGTADNKATADGSGGGIVGADLAAMADNNINSTTSVTIGGKLNVDGDIEIEALQSDTANINADALKATVVGLSATAAENTITGSTTVKFDKAEITGSGKLDTNAANTINFGNTEKYAVEGSGYGGINVQGAVFNNDITKNATIDVIGSNILTAGAQTMEAKTTGNINASGYIKAAGLGAFTWADINNNITTNNNVNVDAGSSLETAEEGADITLAAVDNMDLTVSGVADVQGAAVGGASSDVQSTLTRNNKITVGGDLYAMNDVNLYAGRDKNGSDGKLDLVAESETYNYAALPIANPILDDKIYQYNQVVVNSGSDISSVRNINLYADAGKENVRDTTLMYTWVYSDKQENYTSSTVGDKENNNKDGSNYVQVDGKLTAGVQNKQYITIGGTYDPETGEAEGSQLVFLNTDTLEAVKDYGNGQEGAVGANEITINVSDNIDKNSIEFGTFDYGLELFERYNQLGELMRSYAEKKDGKNSTAYLGYQAEQQRILEQLKAMGLVEEFVGPDNEKYYGAVEGMKVDYIELPDIIASGGNINIQTDALMSNGGELTAQGAPEVVINNNTNLYLKVNNVTVGEAGGEIIYNNVAITSDNNDEINKINTQNGKADKIAAFDSIEADAGDNNVGKLIINGNYGGQEIKAIVKGDFDGDGIEESQEIQTVPRADIEINGIVNSSNGIVEITSANNSIIIQGEDASSSAGVTGKEVHLTASNGSVSQGFHDGITNIGGSVQDLYKDQYESIKDSLDEEYKLDNTNNIHKVVYGDEKEASGNMISGENIYISASDININGSMQSGYADYILDIDASVQDKITEIQQNWQNNGSEVLSDAIITTGDTYKIVVGKNELQSDGSYVRYIDAYYNPYTGKIVVPDVDAKGGKIYLTGRISSTGSGSIKVLDGAYDIKVTNNTGTDLQLGKLVSNNADGLISITDTAKNTITELTRDKTVVKAWNEDANDWTITPKSVASSAYNPQEGLRYNWTTGQEVSTTKTYEHTIKAGLWGAVETVNTKDLTNLEQTLTPVESSDGTSKDKLNGEYIGFVSDIDNSKDFAVIYDNTVMQNSQNGPGEPERWSTGFLGWFKWEKYTWSRTTGTSQQYVASVKADKPISIGFIGNADGNSNIDVTSAGNINLTNNIASASAGTGSVINISTRGAINQLGGSIIGDNINLNTASGINDIGITSMGDNVSLNAVNSGSGNVDVTVNAAYGTKGNVVLGKLSTASGNAALTADGSITQSGADASVIADRIDLVSNNGAIGTAGQALVVQGGQIVTDATNSLSASVNAQAEGNIYLTQADGDLRIGRVYSDNGNVAITVNNGDLIDALPAGEVVDRGNTDELIQKWTDLGLIEGEGAYTDKIQQDIDDYKASISEEYNLYNDMKSYYDEIDNQDKGDPNYLAFEKLQEKYNGYNSAEEYLEKNDEAKNKIAELSQEDKKYWNKDQLLYAISDAIINPDSGATDNIVKDPNIKGNNITVTVNGGSAGLNSDNTTVIGYEDMTNVESLKQLASADASNVTYKDGTFIITEKLPVGIQSTEGITVVTDGNAYLTGRTENDTDNVLNINEIKATSDIRLQGQHGIYNMNAGDRAAITGKNLLIQAGEGSIGSADKMMTIDITGTLQAQGAENIYINQTGANDLVLASVGAGNDIVLQAANNIVNSDTSLAGANSYIRSDEGTISLIAGGNIGKEGNGIRILDNGAVVNADAEQNIYLSGVSGDGSTGELVLGTIEGGNLDVTSESDISLGRDNSVETEENETVNSNINVGSGNVTLTTNSGSITQTAGSIIKANSVKATATQNVLLASNTNQVNNFVVNGYGNDNSLTGNVDLASTVNNDVNVEFGKIVDGEKVGLTVNNGSVNVNSLGNMSNLNITGGSLTTTGENAGNVTFTSAGSITADTVIDSAADIDMNAHGAITNTGSLTAGNNVNVDTSAGDINLGGDVTAQKDVTVHSDKGAIEISGAVTATEEDVDITSGSGAITTTGAITGGTDVNVTTESGAINIGGEDGKGDVIANNGNVNIESGSGNITTTGAISGGTNVTVDAGTTGTIDLGGNVNAKGGNVLVTTDNGYITTTGNVMAHTDVNVNTNAGDITLGGSVQGETGKVTVTTDSGFIKTENFVSGYEDVTLASDGGDITVGGYTESETMNVTATVTGNGNIDFTGTVSASGDVKAEVTGTGNIETGDEASVSGTNIIFTTNDGNITTGSDLTADKNIDLNVNTGNITFGGDVTANDGNITIDITGDGSLTYDKDAENANNTLTAEGQEGSADSGNIIINLKGEGDVDLYDLYATNNARLDIANGNLTLHEINGELVAMQLRTEGKEMDVDKITAGTQIVLTGSDMSLDNIAQRPDADGMLVVTPDGAQADKPIDNFTIGNIQTNAGSGIRFDRLWVNNSDIHISEGQLWFDKLYVENMAHFSNSNMVAGIYGVPPVRDGSDSVYWINTSENRPESDLQAWQAGVGDWMYLRFTDDAIQESNGILLTLDEYDYVYDQRFTAEDHLRYQHGRYLDEDYKQAYGYGVSLHNRYGLIDYQDFTEENAGEDEIAVEA